MKKLKHALIGCGFISEKHMNGYGALRDEVETVALCDILEERLKEAQQKYGIEKGYVDYHELLKDPEIDIVSVCVPNHLHKQIVIDALRAGKNVHCEKPMAMNYEETKEMLAVQKETGKHMIIGLNNRFVPVTQYVKKYIEDGNIGEVYFIKSGWLTKIGFAPVEWFNNKQLSGGGALIDIGVHFIDVAMNMLDYPDLVSVYGKVFDRIITNPEIRKRHIFDPELMQDNWVYDVDDMATGMIQLEGGKIISFEVTWAANIEADKQFYEIYGTKGGIKYEGPGNGDGKIRIYKIDENGNSTIMTPGDMAIAPFESNTEFSQMVHAVKENRNINAIPEQASEAMKIIDAIYESSATGKSVNFK